MASRVSRLSRESPIRGVCLMGLFLREPRDRGVYDAILRGHTILMYWVYLLRCDDDESWYIGYTTNLIIPIRKTHKAPTRGKAG